MRIARTFHWEMGHRLPFHEGGCANVHGHSYRMRVEIEGEPDAHGMVVDFGLVREAVQPMIDELDHAFLCDASDSVLLPLLRAHGFKTVVFPVPSTAENIAAHFLDRVWEKFAPDARIRSVRIRVHETRNSFAETERVRL